MDRLGRSVLIFYLLTNMLYLCWILVNEITTATLFLKLTELSALNLLILSACWVIIHANNAEEEEEEKE